MAAARFPLLWVDAAAERVEELGAVLFELGASGVEVRDEATLAAGPGPGRARLVASFATRAAAERARAALGEVEPALSCAVDEIVGDQWRDKYKEHLRSFALTASVRVVPPWEVPAARPGEGVLVMDPGRAFGTGLHATTALVAAELERRKASLAGQPVLDVGTGSGILALLALRLGAARAHGIDTDPVAIAVATENARRNGLSSRATFEQRRLDEVRGSFAAVVANIETRTLCAMATELLSRARRDGLLVLSGVLAEERDEVLNAYLDAARRCGARLAHRHTARRGQGADAWVALVFRREEP